MWGFSPRENPDTTTYKGRTLSEAYSRPALWLRSDLSRLVRLFNVATPAQVKYKDLERRFKTLDWKKTQADELIHRLQVDNQIRYDLTQQMRELEERTRLENRDLKAENKKMSAKLSVAKVDQAA